MSKQFLTKLIRPLLGTGFALVCLFFLISKLNINVLLVNIKSMNVKLILCASFLLLVNHLMHAIRWKILLEPNFKLPLLKSFRIVMVGVLFNVLLPMRPGELIRILLFKQYFGKGIIEATGSITVERVFDVLTLLFFSGLILLVIDLPSILTVTLQAISISLFVAIAFILLLAHNKNQSKLLLYFINLFGKKISVYLRKFLNNFLNFLHQLCSVKKIFSIFLLSIISWGIVGIGMVALIASFDLNIPFLAGILVMIVTNLGAAIPIAPASIGIYHSLCILALSIWNVDCEMSLAIAIVSHAIMVIIQALGGLLALFFESGFKQRFEDLKQLKKSYAA